LVIGVRPFLAALLCLAVFTGIPPGTWLVAAVDFVEDGQWLDLNYLESLRPFATTITLGRGDDRTLNLELKR
jgi:hypothetical protein